MALYTRRKARKSLIDTVLFRALSQVATVVGYIVMVRSMTKEDFGVFNLLYAFLPVAGTVASLGLEQTLRRYQPEYLGSGNKAAAFWLVKFVASARFGTNVLLLCLLLLTWNYFAPIFKLTPYRAQFAFFALLVLLHFQARILQLSLASHMMHRYSVGSTATLSAVKLAIYCLLMKFDKFTLDYAILADTIAYGIAYVTLNRAYRRHCLPEPGAPAFKPDPGERKRLLKYGIYNNFNDAGVFMLSGRSDNFFIAAFIDPVSVGIYAFYGRLNEMVVHLMPVRLFDNVIQPLFFSVKKENADRSIPQYFTLLLNLTLLIQWPVLVFAICYHAEIVRVVFAGKFIEDSWLLPTVAAFTTLNLFATPVTLVAQYDEKASVILWSKILTIYNVVALLVLLPVAGLYGAAIASGSAQVMKSLFIWWFVRKRAVWKRFWSVIGVGIVIWSVALGACYAVKTWVPVPPIAQIGFGVAICVIVSIVYLRSPAISAEDRRILASVLRGKEARLLRMLGLFSGLDEPGSKKP